MARIIKAIKGTIGLVASTLRLNSCSSPHIDVNVCHFGRRLAFEIGDTRHLFFFRTAARPWNIEIYEPSTDQRWDARVPHELVRSWRHTFQPERSLILYGEKLPGWNVDARPTALIPGKRYSVEIWSDGGMGITNFIAGQALRRCKARRFP